MNFNSLSYLVFLFVVILSYFAVIRRELARDITLLVASYWFYMSWNPVYAWIIIGSTIVDYVLGSMLYCEKRIGLRRFYLIASLFVNLGLLAIFKYFNFFVDSTEQALVLFGGSISLARLDVLLPVGISFYTFQTMSYTIDIYRGNIERETNFVKFAVFVSFFPQLVAGPIVRASQFLPQLHSAPQIDKSRFNQSIVLITQGLFKKIVLADMLSALAVDVAFHEPGSYSSLSLYLALCAYAYQIYNDFSGYSDIAIGSAGLLGFYIPENFNGPYLSRSIREFWSRWHISLSTWLRDYLYIPLGGNRLGEKKTYRNLFVTMLLGGLWHGAAINFVLWGAYHGLLLMLAHRFPVIMDSSSLPSKQNILSPFVRQVICFHLVLFGWLLFRVQNMQAFQLFVSNMCDFTYCIEFSPFFYQILFLSVLIHLVPRGIVQKLRMCIASLPTPLFGGYIAFSLLLLWSCSIGAPAFIYFQF